MTPATTDESIEMTGNESIKDSEGEEVVEWMVSRKEKENEEVIQRANEEN